MHWFILIISAFFEAVWAIALGYSDGFTNIAAIIVFFIALAISMGGLTWATKVIPIGTGYAVWVGIGATATVVYSMARGLESISAMKIVFLVAIIASVIGLKLLPDTADG